MKPAQPVPKSRLEALTDGIFAVTLTLLVLDLHIPQPGVDTPFVREALALVDSMDNYVISFVVLSIFWIAHSRMMPRLREVDVQFVTLNLAFLLFTTFLPPLTTLVGDHPKLPRGAVLYGANLLAIIACEALMWRRVCAHLANETLDDPRTTWRLMRRRYVTAIGVVVAGIGAALVEIAVRSSADLAPWFYLLLIGAGVVRTPLPSHHT